MLSIIIPVYNEEKYIRRTLTLLKALSLPHEIIISDDKSTDATASIAREYTDKVLIPEHKHPTIGANRNAGARTAVGEFLVFIDSSCSVENPDAFFSRALGHFSANPKLVGLTGKFAVDPDAETWGDRVAYFIFNTTNLIKNNYLHIGESPGKFQMVRRGAFDEVGGVSERLVTGEDADFFYRLSKIGRTMYDSKLVIYHSGRRAHAIGWPKLLYIWMVDRFWMTFFGTTQTKSWDRWWESKEGRKTH